MKSPVRIVVHESFKTYFSSFKNIKIFDKISFFVDVSIVVFGFVNDSYLLCLAGLYFCALLFAERWAHVVNNNIRFLLKEQLENILFVRSLFSLNSKLTIVAITPALMVVMIFIMIIYHIIL